MSDSSPCGDPIPPQIETPALVVDIGQLRANIESMARAVASTGARLRPHCKTHKSPRVARLQRDAGSSGITVATLGEAETFADAGFDDIFVAYPLWADSARAPRLRRLADKVHLVVGVESAPAASALARAAPGICVMLEVDCGQHRTGTPAGDTAEVAVACAELGLQVEGVFTHGGHAYSGPSFVDGAAEDEVTAVERALCALREAGMDVSTASAGSTPTALLCARGAVNEVRPGTYVFNDRQQVALGSCQVEQVAAYVAATVVSSSGPGRFVIDAGSKALSGDRPSWLEGFGTLPGLRDTVVVALSEHHGIVHVEPSSTPRTGDVVAVVPNHICTAVNLFDSYLVCSDGEVVDRWKVEARGR